MEKMNVEESLERELIEVTNEIKNAQKRNEELEERKRKRIRTLYFNCHNLGTVVRTHGLELPLSECMTSFIRTCCENKEMIMK